MKNISRIFQHVTVVALVLCSTSAVAQNNVDQLTKQWLELDKSANQLNQNWQQEKQQLELRLSLLSHQNNNLREKINSTNVQKDQVNQQRKDILTKQTLIEQSVELYRQALPSIVDQLQQLMSSLPPSLIAQLSPELTQVSKQKELTGKYQAITNIVKQVAKNSELIHVKNGLVQLEDKELLVQKLFFGHDQAWFITQDNSRAGVGFRKDQQWVWLEQAEYADNIRQAINRAQNQMPGPLVSLPIYLEAK